MKSAHPHFFLFSEAATSEPQSAARHDQWRFVLESVNDGHRFSVTESEPETSGERLELLAVVRGLEALDQPSRVTLVTRSRYVSRGLRRGLDDWRNNRWKWERFGRLVPVKNSDLWQRIDRALKFHELECRTWRFDMPAASAQQSECDKSGNVSSRTSHRPRATGSGGHASRGRGSMGRWIRGITQTLRPRAAACGAA